MLWFESEKNACGKTRRTLQGRRDQQHCMTPASTLCIWFGGRAQCQCVKGRKAQGGPCSNNPSRNPSRWLFSSQWGIPIRPRPDICSRLAILSLRPPQGPGFEKKFKNAKWWGGQTLDPLLPLSVFWNEKCSNSKKNIKDPVGEVGEFWPSSPKGGGLG